MRARTRLILDAALLLGLVAAYKPTWTGITWHEWLCVAIIAPLLLHFTVNWEWALRVARTFVERLLHASRLNFVVDCLLLVATVTVMLSGFMVAPALLAPLGIHPTNALEWHIVHSWSANLTIALLLLHTSLHWRWLFSTARRSLADAAPQRRAVGTTRVTSSEGRLASRSTTPGVTSAQRRSRVGVRAAQAAAERAMAARTLSVVGLTAVLGLVISTGVGLASPFFSSPARAQHVASAEKLVCPQTGCTASKCHASFGESAAAFYGRTAPGTQRKPAAKAKAKRATTTVATAHAVPPKSHAATHAVAKRVARTSAQPSRNLASIAVARPAPKPAQSAPKKRLYVCPQTGCARSSCHGTHHQSPGSFYN